MNKTILPLVIYPDSRLNQISAKVDKIDDNIRSLLTQMADAVYEYKGFGISGVQLGIMKNLIVIDYDGVLTISKGLGNFERLNRPLFMINAEVIEFSDEKTILNEGCLSLPTIDVDVTRPMKVRVKYLDYDGNEQIIESDDKILAKCLQHEIDHTNGILIIDHIKSFLKKQICIKKLLKYSKFHTGCECHNNVF